jgi:hypothetical protein
VPKITTLRIGSKPNQMGRFVPITMHHVNANIPLFVLFRALGVERQGHPGHDRRRFADGHFVYKELAGCALECGQNGRVHQEAAMDCCSRTT